MKKIIMITAFVLFISALGLADKITIPDDYSTIQAGINAAQNGDEVYVREGTYNEQIVIPDKEIDIYGFAIESGPQTIIRWYNGDVVIANNTEAEWQFSSFKIVPLNRHNRGVRLTNVENAELNVTVSCSGGFTGNWTDYPACGAGILIDNCENINIHTTLYSCKASYGGGIHCIDSDIAEMEIDCSENGFAIKGGTLYIVNSTIEKLQAATDYFSFEEEYFYPTYSLMDGGFIYADESVIYVENIEYAKESRDRYDDYGLYCYGCESGDGGAIALTNDSHLLINYYSYFENNSCSTSGGAIYCDNGMCLVSNCIFENNEAHESTDTGGAINSGNGGGVKSLLIYQCVFLNDSAELGDCIRAEELQQCVILNSIFWDQNGYEYIYLDDVTYSNIRYCCLQHGEDNAVYGGEIFEGNISEDPFLDNDYTLKWDATHFSPCIDTGDPNWDWDDDDTPPDMGAIPADAHAYFQDDYDNYTYDAIDWISFPVLNRITNNWMDAIDVLERQDLIDDDPSTDDILNYVLYQNDAAVWFDGGWQTDLTNGDFDSKQGYKFVLNLPIPHNGIPVKAITGTWLDESTPIQLYANQENWIGCYLEEPAVIADAFESIGNDWSAIYSEHWAVECPEPGVYPASVHWLTVNPGELYIVEVYDDCQLIWNESEEQKDAFVREATDYFTYMETVDYMAIDVDTVCSDTSVAEIAVYSDDQCLGASKVYDDEYPVQILAYTPDSLKSGTNGLEFRLYYGGQKGESTKSIPYVSYNKEIQAYIEKPLNYKRKSFATVKLNTDESSFNQQLTLFQNYPNPVRTNMTTIRFMPNQNAAHTELSIYNIRGQLVRTIDCDGIISAGTKDVYYSISWDCCDRYGKDVKNGIYFYKLTSGNKSALH